MKKILALLILVFSLASCGKDSKTEEPIGEIGTDSFDIKKLLDEIGIKPSDWQNINTIYGVDDSINYKLVWGQQDTSAWIAKFQPDGTEIWNYKFPIKYSIIYNREQPAIINNTMFLITVSLFDYYYTDKIYLSIINFTSGNIISQTELKKELSGNLTAEFLSNYYKLMIGYKNFLIDNDGKIFWEGINEYQYPCFDNIFIYWHADDANYFMYTLINKKGEIIWQRGTVSETEKGFPSYGDEKTRIFLDNERLFYINWEDYSEFNIINLKEYTLLYTLTKEQIPMKGDNFEKENITYLWDTCYIKNNDIHLIYKEEHIATDPISGTFTFETIGKYYYDIDKDTYQVVGNGKLE